MIRALDTIRTGLQSEQTKLNVISNNLANLNTTGFKRQRPLFKSLLYNTVRNPGAYTSQRSKYPSGLQIGAGAEVASTQPILTQGNLSKTGSSLDVAINGSGFFRVQMPNGQTAYTRDGAFQENKNGRIVTAQGYPVSPAITIPKNATSVNIGGDGTVTVKIPGQANSVQVGQIQLATFTNPGGLKRIGGNLYKQSGSSGNPTTTLAGRNGSGTLQQGYLEDSNVSVVGSMVDMIGAQRAYQLDTQDAKAANQMLGYLANT